MAFCEFFIVFNIVGTLFPLIHAFPYSPWLMPQHQAPLYEGIKLLISDAVLQATLTWNETEFQLNEAVTVISEKRAFLHNYEVEIEERIRSLFTAGRPSSGYNHCYHHQELAIDTLQRELLPKYHSCMRALDVSLVALRNESNNEIKFIRNAAAEARNLFTSCNVIELERKRHSSDLANVITMCIVGRIGALDQRLSEATENFSNELATVTLSEDEAGVGNNDCDEFEQLHRLFESVYEDIHNCIERKRKA